MKKKYKHVVRLKWHLTGTKFKAYPGNSMPVMSNCLCLKATVTQKNLFLSKGSRNIISLPWRYGEAQVGRCKHIMWSWGLFNFHFVIWWLSGDSEYEVVILMHNSVISLKFINIFLLDFITDSATYYFKCHRERENYHNYDVQKHIYTSDTCDYIKSTVQAWQRKV